MKSETFSLNDIESILLVPRPTIVHRMSRFGIKPIEKRLCHKKLKHFYSNEQLQRLKEYFQSEQYKPTPVEPNYEVIGYEIDHENNCTIIIRSRLNYIPLNQL